MTSLSKRAAWSQSSRNIATKLATIDRNSSAVSADELFDMIDKNGSGTIDRAEFVRLHEQMKIQMFMEHKKEAVLEEAGKQMTKKADRAVRRSRLMCCVIFVLGIFAMIMLSVNAILTYSVVEFSKETTASTSGVLQVKGSEEVAKTAEALVAIPLVLAPLMPLESLEKVKQLTLSRLDWDANAGENVEITEFYRVDSYTWRSNTSMTFYTSRGDDRLELHDGAATLHRNNGDEHPVCAADVSCSAFKMSTLDVDALAELYPDVELYVPAYNFTDILSNGTLSRRRALGEDDVDHRASSSAPLLDVHAAARRILQKGGGSSEGGCTAQQTANKAEKTWDNFNPRKDGKCLNLQPRCQMWQTKTNGKTTKPGPFFWRMKRFFSKEYDWTNLEHALQFAPKQKSRHFDGSYKGSKFQAAFHANMEFVGESQQERLDITLFFIDLVTTRLLFKGAINDILKDPLNLYQVEITQEISDELEFAMELQAACWEDKRAYPCAASESMMTYALNEQAQTGRRRMTASMKAHMKEHGIKEPATSAENDRRGLTHASGGMVAGGACASATVGGGTGTGVEALGCLLKSIYGHYPFNDAAFQQAFDIFGFKNVESAAVDGLTATDKAGLTSTLAKAFMENGLAETSSATQAWLQPMTLSSGGGLPVLGSVPAAGGRRLSTQQAAGTITREQWLEGHWATLHHIHAGMDTSPSGLDLYFDWACEYKTPGSTGCAILTTNDVVAALGEPCLYEPYTHLYCTPGTAGCPANPNFATYPYCCVATIGSSCTLPPAMPPSPLVPPPTPPSPPLPPPTQTVPGRRLEQLAAQLDAMMVPPAAVQHGRQLAHTQGNGMCHPASSTLARCEDGAPLRIDAAAVGDSIRTPSGCEPITGLFHADADAIGAYHKLSTRGGATVAISDGHWLFVNGVEADPATVKVGDRLTTASGLSDTVVRVAKATEQGAFHILVASGAYYVDGVAASTYIAHVPLGVWKVVADGYASLRYKMGVPIAPEGQGYLSITWPLAVYEALGVSSATATNALWPLTAAAAVTTELANTLAVPAAVVLGAARLVRMGRK